jgi:protein required for attachment to host cells
MSYWILIADASGARIFSTDGPEAPLRRVREISNPSGRARNQDLVSDQPGRAFEGGGTATRSAMEPRTTPHNNAADTFAAELAKLLDAEAGKKSFSSLAIVAPPHLLGTLRARLSRQVRQLLRATLDRDLAHVAERDLHPHLNALFVPGVFNE